MSGVWDWPAAVSRRSTLAFALVSVVLAAALVYGLNSQPSYTDAYYYTNVAVRMSTGQGMTDPYLWTYMEVPETLTGAWTIPSHQYWMPMASLMAAAGMVLAGAPDSYAAGQLLFVLAAWGLALIGFAVGARLGRTVFTAWLAGLLTILSPFYAFYWGVIDSTTPFALAGAACILVLGMAVCANRVTKRSAWWWAAAGALAGLAHLSRPDGLLFLGIAGLFVLVLARRSRRWAGLWMLLPVMLAYALVLLPWWLRNMQALGTALPTGGAAGMFFTDYDDLFAYPAGASLGGFLETAGWRGFLDTRWLALVGEGGISGNLGTFLAVEGMIFLAPLMLIGLVKRWRNPFLWPFIVAAIGIHVVMTLVFSFAGYRGGLLHSAGALVPFWAALGVVGLRDVLEWVARRRRNWRPASAMRVFGVALLGFAVLLLVMLAARHADGPADHEQALYIEIDALLPDGARLFSADPPEVYYLSGRGGAVIPQAAPEVLPELAARFDIGYLLLQEHTITHLMNSAWDAPPAFLRELPLNSAGARLYEIAVPESAGR